MLDFLVIEERTLRNGTIEISPNFRTNRHKDLMIKGGDFDAFWNEKEGMWCKDESALIDMVDEYLKEYRDSKYNSSPFPVKVLWMWDARSGSIDLWHKYCRQQLRDSYHVLDQKIIFSNTPVTKEDYASHRLPFPLEEGDISAYEKCMGTWYNPPDKTKLEWGMGGIIAGDIDIIEKFFVLYGPPKSGKSSFLKHILYPLFEGYWAPFDASTIAKGGFWGESFKTNPLVSVQTDGKLSRIEDNSVLNAIISHEVVEINLKNKSTYPQKMRTVLFLGTNEPVKISDAKSGIIRRLIDVTPSGRTLPEEEYYEELEKLKFEYGAIAQHCLTVYSKLGPYYYNDYVATEMLAETNDFYNFIEKNYEDLRSKDYITANEAWRRWQDYKTFADIEYKFPYKKFCTELKNYFREYKDDWHDENGKHIRSVYTGFIFEKFKSKVRVEQIIERANNRWIILKEQHSLLDDILSDCPAQYAVETGEKPIGGWDYCKTKLSDIDTTRLHFVRPPLYLIMVDFDIRDANGEKSLKLNLDEANKWPKTYAEVSKSGGGLHLYYIYTGDPMMLANTYNGRGDIEIKVYNGKGAIRRISKMCNDIPIAKISSGLPLKEEANKVVDFELYSNEKALRTCIDSHIKNWMSGEVHTTPTIKRISQVVEKAYDKGFTYDISDMYKTILDIARRSTNQSRPCEDIVNKMHFRSKKEVADGVGIERDTGKLVIFDIEVYPNLLLIAWKYEFSDTFNCMKNPSSSEVEDFFTTLDIIGFNNLRYDNPIIYARAMGRSIHGCYEISHGIIHGEDVGLNNRLAKAISYCDIFDMASAPNKQSLKKYEIELGRLERKAKHLFREGCDIPTVSKKLKTPEILVNVWYERRDKKPLSHLEIGYDWDADIPESEWPNVEQYCKNDVQATEDVLHYLDGDFKARKMLAALSGLPVNETTNNHTAQIIFGNEREPWKKFVYTDLSTIFPGYIPLHKSPDGKSHYRGDEPSEGGYVYSEPSVAYNVATIDLESGHPTSTEVLNALGPWTPRFGELKRARILIKHKDFEGAKQLLDGKLAPFLDNPDDAKAISNALKTAINAVYGQTDAKYQNRFRDPRNVDNIIAKYEALFMIDLKYFVQGEGYRVVHIKTDSIKIENADINIINKVHEFGKKYGFKFSHESTYSKMCLVNKSVYIAKYADAEWCQKKYGYIPDNNQDEGGKWTATGTQFQHPYIFKTLFSKEPLEFDDLCEIKSVSTALYLDLNEGCDDVQMWETVKSIRRSMNSIIPNYEPKLSKKEQALLEHTKDISDEKLDELISSGHNYKFVGRVGEFVPIKPGKGGGILARKSGDQFTSANGAKGYRWLEAEDVRLTGKEADIDMSYYEKLADAAVKAISQHCNFDKFVGEDIPDDFINIPENVEGEELPFN